MSRVSTRLLRAVGCCATSRTPEGAKIGRRRVATLRHVATLMRRMGVEAIHRRPDTSKPAPGHKVRPYLLRDLPVTRPDQVWAMDLGYVPTKRGFVYRAAVVDRFSRRVLARRLSITTDAAFRAETLEGALARHGRPEILDTDQGSRFTDGASTGVLTRNKIAIGMDGKGAWRDDIFVERPWRSVKYEEVCLGAHDAVAEARASVGRHLSLYSTRRPHSSLDRQVPDRAYFTRLPRIAAA